MASAPRSLQGRLLVGLLGAVVLVWLVTATVTWLDARHELDELLDSHLAQAAALLVAQQADELGEEEHARTTDAPQLHRYSPQVAFQVWHEGRLVLRSASAPATPMVADAPGPGFHAARFGDADWRVFVARGAERDVLVYVGEQVASRDHILWAIVRGLLGPMALALPLLAAAIWWAVRRGTAPLRALGRTLAQRHPQALEPVAVPGAPAEMLPMVDALNRLFERITTMVAAERRFTADAAHELRTPIAAIRTQAQVALAETDAAERAHALRATLAGCDRAARLVDQLLTLSRLEAGASLAQRVVGDLAPRAIDRRQTLGLDAEPGCQVHGSDTLLAVLVRNLVDNALRYSPDDAEVRVAVARAGGQVRLQVDDSGPGLADADLARLGERFFRVLGSGQDGSGLGWSIVRRIAAAHGATVTAGRSAALGGLAVTVCWPARTSAGGPGAA
jgi:two-component system, OmpR family, sensor histidine kinase QseC